MIRRSSSSETTPNRFGASIFVPFLKEIPRALVKKGLRWTKWPTNDHFQVKSFHIWVKGEKSAAFRLTDIPVEQERSFSSECSFTSMPVLEICALRYPWTWRRKISTISTSRLPISSIFTSWYGPRCARLTSSYLPRLQLGKYIDSVNRVHLGPYVHSVNIARYTWSGSWVPFTHIQPTTRRILPYFIGYWWITCN